MSGFGIDRLDEILAATRLIRSTKTPWAFTRAEVLVRKGYRCEECGSRATEVDHIWPRRWGGRNDFGNLRPLCGPCNRRKGATADVSSAPSVALLDSLNVAVERFHDDLASVPSEAMLELALRVRRGDVDPSAAWHHVARAAEAAAYLSGVVQGWASVLLNEAVAQMDPKEAPT